MHSWSNRARWRSIRPRRFVRHGQPGTGRARCLIMCSENCSSEVLVGTHLRDRLTGRSGITRSSGRSMRQVSACLRFGCCAGRRSTRSCSSLTYLNVTVRHAVSCSMPEAWQYSRHCTAVPPRPVRSRGPAPIAFPRLRDCQCPGRPYAMPCANGPGIADGWKSLRRRCSARPAKRIRLNDTASARHLVGQQAIKLLLDYLVALARMLFQACTIQNLDAAPAVFDQAEALQFSG